jgi:peroxiredoxin Q/BCP
LVTPFPRFLLLAMATAVAPGDLAPDVAAKNQDGRVIRISELRGKKVLVYFYPKDDTPGCTKEACSLRDQYARFIELGVVILGVSRQDAESHRAFRKKYHLPFDLLTDEGGSFAKAFGVSTMPVLGFHKRQSVLIGADGRVVAFFPNVDPATHSQEILRVLGGGQGKQVAPASEPAGPR